MSIVRAAGVVIYRKVQSNIEYLLLQASYPNYHWSPPKGHVDPGEDEEVTAFRELFEEAGIKKDDINLCSNFEKVLHYEAHGKPKSVKYYLAEYIRPATEVVLSREHKDYKWLPLDEACKLANFEDIQQLLRDCHQFLSR